MGQVIDNNVVEELLALGEDGDAELLVDLIREFLEHGPDQVEAVLQGLEDQDFSQVERAALALKGSAGNLGVLKLHGTCERLHSASKQHELDELRQLVPAVKRNFEEAFEALEQLLEVYG
jgi:HPt (histidine-containing phosphotransfer) domain-containing protein